MELPGLTKKSGNSRDDQEKNMWNYQESFFGLQRFYKGCNNYAKFPGVK